MGGFKVYRLRVKEVIKRKGATISGVSRGADLSINMVRRMCNNPAYAPTYITLARVAEYLGVPMEDLYYKVEDEKEGSEPSE
ncbi:MAG TPA: helix-turn-helix transcriptional regulator [Ktedonobacteraceae bacterium]|nr:helix-turn-helix transcriptional regulator [Ktedonobacteraceae bacterium]